MKKIREKQRDVTVFAGYDVVVIGGGIAGAAAGIAAARNGATACIIEKQFAPGGLATLGNVVMYLPLCDGYGHQVIKGLGEELLKLSISDGHDSIPAGWKKGGKKRQRMENRYRVRFNPAYFTLALEELILESGTDIMYDTRFCSVRKERGIITHVIVENKEGRRAIACKSVVDASGDADVCAAAGEETVVLKTNIAAGWFFCLEHGNLKLHVVSGKYDHTGKTVPDGKRGFSGVCARDVAEQAIITRRIFHERLQEAAKNGENPCPVLLPSIPGFRMTRRLKGTIELNESDERRIFKDTVGMTGDWRKAGPVYYIPLSALAGVKTKNLVTAGRCISSDSAWDITRAIPTCVVTGQAAGTAAALASRRKIPDLAGLNIKKLQKRLKEQSVPVDEKVPLPRIT